MGKSHAEARRCGGCSQKKASRKVRKLMEGGNGVSEANVTPTVNQKFELRIPKRRSRKRFRVADEVRNRKKLDGIAVKLEDKATGGSDYKTSRAAAQIGNGASPALNKNRRDSG